MRYWIGIALTIGAVWLLAAAYAHRRRVIAARAAAAARGIAPAEPGLRSVAVFGEIMRPVILFLLAYAAIKTVLLYVALDGQELLSWFDLAGMLALLGAYGVWMSVRTTYRASDLAAAMAKADGGSADGTDTPVKLPPYVGKPANDTGPPDGGLPRVRGAR
jgi:hypothetical protein